MVEEGSFRSDLYFRLKVIEIKMPELKAHRQDIPLYAVTLFTTITSNREKNVQYLTKEAEKNFMTYHFPGNIRELSNIFGICYDYV